MHFLTFMSMALVVSLGLANPSHAGSLDPVPCSTLKDPVQARQCMLARQIEDTRIAGDRIGTANFSVLDESLTAEERLAILRARQQMAAMADEEDERVVLGPVGSGGGVGAFAPLLLLLLLFGLGGGGGSSGGPISPS